MAPPLPDAGWRLEQTYAGLPPAFFATAVPATFRAPRVAILNHRFAAQMGLDLGRYESDEAAALFSGQTLPPGARPIAQAYVGHQFGHPNMLGDGRALLVGEQRTPDGRLLDVQFKGSGPTRYSRRGDGLAALGPMLREYIISEAMAALGIPTTRSLAVVLTGERVFRETVRKGAVLTRVAASHLRVGTFEYARALDDDAALQALADYAIARHDPDLVGTPEPYLAFFRKVLRRQAELVARWQMIGFVHGVMNTDNVALSGETIDYGPCAFLDRYQRNAVFSSIDTGGRYAYGNQPSITLWNLTRFAEALLPLFATDPDDAVRLAEEALAEFPARFDAAWLAGMRRKLGLTDCEEGDRELAEELLGWMEAAGADFTATFRDLATVDPQGRDERFRAWHTRWRVRVGPGGPDVKMMRQVNPAVIPRNRLVEDALTAAEERDDLTPMHALLAALERPYEELPGLDKYREPPAEACGYRTFCGT